MQCAPARVDVSDVEEGNEREWVTFLDIKSLFNDIARSGCEQSFRYELSDSSSSGSMDQDLRFDDEAGSFMFANDTSPVSHAFDIVVENRGGTTQLMNTGFGCAAVGYSLNAFSHSFNPTQRIENCQVSRECGPWSTTVQCPEQPPVTSTYVQGKAAVTNAACRVIDIALTEESTA